MRVCNGNFQATPSRKNQNEQIAPPPVTFKSVQKKAMADPSSNAQLFKMMEDEDIPRMEMNCQNKL
jgi:galactose-1-phosphate uridylyltransferase